MISSAEVVRFAGVFLVVCGARAAAWGGGMRSTEPLPEFLAAAVSGGGNAGFSIGLDGVGRLECSDGTTVLIGRATEGRRLSMLLGCGVHTRCCTPHCVRSVDDLICSFCTTDDDLTLLGRARPSTYERIFLSAMDSSRLGWRLWPQVQLPWWHGCIDFVDRLSGVCFQVDGEQHFLGTMYGTPRAEFVLRDAASCAAALGSGSVLVRLHYRDVLSGTGPARAAAVMRGAEAWPCRPCVLLSPSFNLVDPTSIKTIPKQLRLLNEIWARCPACMYSDPQRWIFIQL